MTQFNIEAEGAASQIEQKIDELLDRIVSQEASTEGGFAEYTTDGDSIARGNPLHNKEELKLAILQLITEARKESYSLGFNTAKDVYRRKMIVRKVAYSDILEGYRQSTGIQEDLFTRFLEDKGELRKEIK